jgi:hypothetical protein
MIHHLLPNPDRCTELAERVQEARRAVLSQIDAQAVRHGFTEQLRAVIQALIDVIVASPARLE